MSRIAAVACVLAVSTSSVARAEPTPESTSPSSEPDSDPALAQAQALYTDGPLAHEFPRTISRLNEMQSAEFLALDRRMVDTRLT